MSNPDAASATTPVADAPKRKKRKPPPPPRRLAAGLTGVALLVGGFVAIGTSHLLASPGSHLLASPGGTDGGSRSAKSRPASRPMSAAARRRASTFLAGRLESASEALAPRTTLPADCIPKPQGPPGAPYQLGLVGTVHDGVLTAGAATVADITAKFCGIVTVVNGKLPCGATGSVISPKDGQVFGTLSATLTLVPGMSPKVPFVAHPGTITGGFTCESSGSGLAITMNATVSGSTGLYGLSCTIGPLTLPLSGVLTGPLSDASITLKGNNFGVPVVSPSPTCPGQVPANLDAIAGLPIHPGGASVTLPATAYLYQPGT